jgi:hypothetical protein
MTPSGQLPTLLELPRRPRSRGQLEQLGSECDDRVGPGIEVGHARPQECGDDDPPCGEDSRRAVVCAYEAEPELADMRVDFTATLTEMSAVVLAGLFARR